MSRKQTNQLSMFSQGEDLPLFSGTAQTITVDAFKPAAPPAKQLAFEIGDTITVQSFGRTIEMVAIGRGKFPYECRAQDKHPDSMIFRSVDDSSWVGAYELQDTGLGYFIIVYKK